MKRLYRSRTNRVLAGICGGLGEYLRIDPTIMRVIFLILLFATGIFPFSLFYMVAIFVIPTRPDSGMIYEDARDPRPKA
jgi:phage shock protein C